MRNLIYTILVLFIGQSNVLAQIHGNGILATQTRNFEEINELLININGNVKVICNSPENKIELTYDENIVNFVATDYDNGFIEIGQKKWIEGSSEIEIVIYTNNLESLYNDSWSKIKVVNIDQDELLVSSTISEIYLEGELDDLELISESSNIDAKDLVCKEAKVKIKEDGRIYVNVTDKLKVKKSVDGYVEYIGNPQNVSGLSQGNMNAPVERINTKFIDVSFKNNSLKWFHAYVRGPKPDGKYFSYGLSFGPMNKKKERWTIGTKLYKVNKLGKKTLMHEVTAEDEDQLIKLF